MKGADGIGRGYNAQAAVEPTLLLIVEQSVTEAANGKKATDSDGGTHRTTVGAAAEAILADNGYCSEENLEFLESNGQPERKVEAISPKSPFSVLVVALLREHRDPKATVQKSR